MMGRRHRRGDIITGGWRRGWKPVGGLPASKTVYAFAASPTEPKIMFAGFREGAFNSTDGGESWKKLNTAPKDVAAIAIHPMKPEVVFLGTVPGKIFKSMDAGQTWRRQN